MHITDLTTPCVVIDKNIVENNLKTTQKIFDDLNINFRPHIKTHKLIEMAKWQLELGAVGINCQKISEAIPFVKSGITDILITYNIIGTTKLDSLYQLSQQCDLKVTADSKVCINGLSNYFTQKNTTLKVLVECDTGGQRCGVQTPEQALELAQLIHNSPNLEFYGLLTYPDGHKVAEVEDFLAEAKQLIDAESIPITTISSGGTPALLATNQYSVITEYRAGAYIYNDIATVASGAVNLGDCALSVQTTVVSVPNQNRCIVDSGSKSLTSDLLGQTSYGYVKQFPNAKIVALTEEHGHLDISACNVKPKIGDIVNIIPNHCCPVTNLFDTVTFINGQEVITTYEVDARGCVV